LQDSEGAKDIITQLERIPIDINLLKNTKIGNLLHKVSKAAIANVSEAADALARRWQKQVLPASSPSAATTVATPKGATPTATTAPVSAAPASSSMPSPAAAEAKEMPSTAAAAPRLVVAAVMGQTGDTLRNKVQEVCNLIDSLIFFHLMLALFISR
jgi:hypothetical protein